MVRRRRLAARYADRSVAGRLLAEALVAEAALERPIVLALPRGGVPVAAEVAAQLNAPLGVILVRKIGVPGRSELAMGALAMIDGQLSEFRNDEIVDGLGISSQTFDAARNRELVELERRASIFPYLEIRRRRFDGHRCGRRLGNGLDHAGGSIGCPGAPAGRGCRRRSGRSTTSRAGFAGGRRSGRLPLRSRTIHRGRRRVPRFPAAQ